MDQEREDFENRPDNIVNGFQFNSTNAKLMAYALNLRRLGAEIGMDFWSSHIIDDAEGRGPQPTDMLLHQLKTDGPIITRRNFSIFDSHERCLKDAAVILRALELGLSHIHGALIEIWALTYGEPQQRLSDKQIEDLGRGALRYLTSRSNFEDSDVRVSSATVRSDSEPVLIRVPHHPRDQYVFSGSWTYIRHLGPRAEMLGKWHMNHQLTEFRMKQLLNIYLTKFHPEKFKA